MRVGAPSVATMDLTLFCIFESVFHMNKHVTVEVVWDSTRSWCEFRQSYHLLRTPSHGAWAKILALAGFLQAPTTLIVLTPRLMQSVGVSCSLQTRYLSQHPDVITSMKQVGAGAFRGDTSGGQKIA